MTTLLQTRIQSYALPAHEASLAGAGSPSEVLNYGVLAAYAGCFRTMAIITAITLPGVLLFRALRPDAVAPTAVKTGPVRRERSTAYAPWARRRVR